MNQNVIGNVKSHNAQNQNANWFVKIQIADHPTSVASVKQELQSLVQDFQCSKKWKKIKNAVHAIKEHLPSDLKRERKKTLIRMNT